MIWYRKENCDREFQIVYFVWILLCSHSKYRMASWNFMHKWMPWAILLFKTKLIHLQIDIISFYKKINISLISVYILLLFCCSLVKIEFIWTRRAGRKRTGLRSKEYLLIARKTSLVWPRVEKPASNWRKDIEWRQWRNKVLYLNSWTRIQWRHILNGKKYIYVIDRCRGKLLFISLKLSFFFLVNFLFQKRTAHQR